MVDSRSRVDRIFALKEEPDLEAARAGAWKLVHSLARWGRSRELEELFNRCVPPNPLPDGLYEVDWMTFPIAPRVRLVEALSANILRLWPRPLPWFHIIDGKAGIGDTCPVGWSRGLCQFSVPGYPMPDVLGGAGFSMFPFRMEVKPAPMAPHRPSLHFNYMARERGLPFGPVRWLTRRSHIDVVEIVPGVNLCRLLVRMPGNFWWNTGHYVHRRLASQDAGATTPA